MKKLLIALMALFCISTYAQEKRGEERGPRKEMQRQRPDLSPEQMAELATKKLTLHLDLSEAQQKKVNSHELERAKARKSHYENKSDRKKLSDKERFEQKTQRMDAQIAHKKEMKSILNDEQYQKWEKGKSEKGNRNRSKRNKPGHSGKNQ